MGTRAASRTASVHVLAGPIAVIFGVSDGLVSNLSLVMGVAGAASENPSFILLAGIAGLLHDADLQGEDLVAPAGSRREEFVAMLEAPRGTLTHHYRVDENDQVTMANLIVSTTCNNEAMNRAVGRIAEQKLSGEPVITEGLLNNIEVGIRAYDPCLSCATHALGQMPLEVTLVGADGSEIDRLARPA